MHLAVSGLTAVLGGLTAMHACLCIQLSNEIGVNRLKEPTRTLGHCCGHCCGNAAGVQIGCFSLFSPVSFPSCMHKHACTAVRPLTQPRDLTWSASSRPPRWCPTPVRKAARIRST